MENKLSIETAEGLRVKLSSAEPIATHEVELLLQAMGVECAKREIGSPAPVSPDPMLVLAGESLAFEINLGELDGEDELKALVKGLSPANKGILKNELAKYDLGTYEKDLEARPLYLAEVLNECGDGEISAIVKALGKDKALHFRQELAKIKIRAPFEEHASDVIILAEVLSKCGQDEIKAIVKELNPVNREVIQNALNYPVDEYLASELEKLPFTELKSVVTLLSKECEANLLKAIGLNTANLEKDINFLAGALDKLSAPQLKVLRSNISQSTRRDLRPFPAPLGADD